MAIGAIDVVHDHAELIDEGLDREAWLKARRAGIGSSDAAALIGWDPYSSPMKVYADKLGLSEPDFDTHQAAFGRLVEPWLVEQAAERTGHVTWRNVALFRNRLRPWQLCTPDGFAWLDAAKEAALVEAKSTIFEWDRDRVPPDIWCQVQHQLLTTGLRRAIVICLNRDTCEVRIYWVELDLMFADRLLRAEQEFVNRLAAGEPPDPDGSKACLAALKRLYPEHVEGKWLTGGGDLIEADAALEEAKTEIKRWEEARQTIENDLIARIGDAEGILLPNGFSYSNRAQTRAAHTRVIPESTYRVLRRHKPGKGKKTKKKS